MARAIQAAENFLTQRVASSRQTDEAQRKAATQKAKKERAAAAVARIQAEASAVAIAGACGYNQPCAHQISR